MVGYVALAMWQVKHWMNEARDANYVNGLRQAHFDRYVADHPEETKEAAALAAGFSSYNSYYRAKQKFEVT